MSAASASSRRPGVLSKLGLNRKELRAWALYDWANSGFATTIMGAILPIYFIRVAATDIPLESRTAYWGYTQSVALVIIAVISPILGATADFLGAKKKFLAAFATLGAIGCLMLFWVRDGDWFFASAAFIIGNIGYAAGNVFYESLLPHVAEPEEIDQVSTAGYAVGYVGGGLLLAMQLAWITWPRSFGFEDGSEASRWAFVSVGIWWLVFTLPLLRGVEEPRYEASVDEAPGTPLLVGFRRVVDTFGELRHYRHLFVFLLAFWFYNDGINTIIKMATAFGTEVGIAEGHLIGAFLLVQFLGIPATFAYGLLAMRIGAKNGIYLALGVYAGISVLGYFMSQPWHFWTLAVVLAFVQGGSQALSRSLFATMVPPSKSSQFFGFYSISGKFGNIVGPLVFAIVADVMGSSRFAILSLVVFFLIGIALLSRVDLAEGRAAAVRAEAASGGGSS